jgi:hypothetical protein
MARHGWFGRCIGRDGRASCPIHAALQAASAAVWLHGAAAAILGRAVAEDIPKICRRFARAFRRWILQGDSGWWARRLILNDTLNSARLPHCVE